MSKSKAGLNRKKFLHGNEQPELEKQFLKVYAAKERRNRKRMKQQLQYANYYEDDDIEFSLEQ